MHQVDKVSAVVYYDIRSRFQHFPDMGAVLLLRGPVPCEHVESFMHKGSCHIVLCGQRIAARDIHFGSSCSQSLAQICCLGLKVHGKGDFQSAEWFFQGEFLFKSVEKGHVMTHPVDFQPALWP